MINRDQPTITTITTAEQPPERTYPVIRHPLVRRRVADGREMTISGRTFREGECLTISADQAFVFEQAGVLVRTDDAA